MGTFSILFRMVLRSTPPIFSFVLIFSKPDQKMSHWTIHGELKETVSEQLCQRPTADNGNISVADLGTNLAI